MKASSFKFLFAAIFALAGGCAEKAFVLSTDGIVPAADYSGLAAVLNEAVDADGFIVSQKLSSRHDDLVDQCRLLAVSGPTATPALYTTDDDRLAHWYNARTAWACMLAMPYLDSGRIGLAGNARRFRLDGRTMTLELIDAEIEALAGWQGVVAAPSAMLSRAHLPQRPFAGETVREQIAQRLERFIDGEKRFVIDIRRKTVFVCEPLWRYRGEIIAEHQRLYGVHDANLITSLLPYTGGSAARRLQDAVGYDVRPRKSSELAVRKENDGSY